MAWLHDKGELGLGEEFTHRWALIGQFCLTQPLNDLSHPQERPRYRVQGRAGGHGGCDGGYPGGEAGDKRPRLDHRGEWRHRGSGWSPAHRVYCVWHLVILILDVSFIYSIHMHWFLVIKTFFVYNAFAPSHSLNDNIQRTEYQIELPDHYYLDPLNRHLMITYNTC